MSASEALRTPVGRSVCAWPFATRYIAKQQCQSSYVVGEERHCSARNNCAIRCVPARTFSSRSPLNIPLRTSKTKAKLVFSTKDSDNEIKAQIILNTSNKELRKYALTDQPDLTKLLNKARTLEATTAQLGQIEGKQTQATYKISRERNNIPSKNKTKCKNCGNNWHNEGKDTCPAKGINPFEEQDQMQELWKQLAQ
ncbi:hypothetical protein QE152_g26179 [Popillia japonica]|uniref:Uncharacterized protein n=1 Tax=Popillia japonica TaxID=7064 RepID=A0AAW1JYI8_POPJA